METLLPTFIPFAKAIVAKVKAKWCRTLVYRKHTTKQQNMKTCFAAERLFPVPENNVRKPSYTG
jgi:hypothetical protein